MLAFSFGAGCSGGGSVARYILVLPAIALALLVAWLMRPWFEPTNVVMVYFLAVILVTLRLGFGPAIITAFVGITAFDLVNVPPFLEFSDSDVQYVFTLAVMLFTAFTIHRLMQRWRDKVSEAAAQERRSSALYHLSAELMDAKDIQVIDAILSRHLAILPASELSAPVGDASDVQQAMQHMAEQAHRHYLLQQQMRQAQLQYESEQLRNTILNALSHDLRTPLATIIGAASSLQDTQAMFAPEARQQMMAVIHDEALHMKGMVQNFLDMARLHSKAAPVQMDWQAAEEIIGNVLQAQHRRQISVRITTSIPNCVPLVRCDGYLLERVLDNLVDNAIRHGHAQHIRLGCEQQGAQLCFFVSDDGCGMSTQDSSRAFEPFTRLSGDNSGTGIGLTICRDIIKAHGGDIWIDAPPGQGTTVYFTLPMPDAAPAVPAEPEAES